MKIINFDDLSVTTMTVIANLSGVVDINAFHHFIPITKIENTFSRTASKCKLPHCKIPGSIISLKGPQGARGIVKNQRRAFKNALSFDVSTTVKNINMKLAPESMQMCGASSMKDAKEATEHVIRHIKNAQNIIDEINNDKTTYFKTVNWVKKNTKGKKIEIIDQETGGKIYDYEIVLPESSIPEDVSQKISDVLISFFTCGDFYNHRDFCAKLDYINKYTKIYDNPIEVIKISAVMINYNFSLGFPVERIILNESMSRRSLCKRLGKDCNKCVEGCIKSIEEFGKCSEKCKHKVFISRYNNALVNNVTIELPYKRGKYDHITKRRENEVPYHTFLVYRSGSVTLSSKNQPEMKKAYYKFMKNISAIESKITLDN
jgi:TATA-box binding protein (TBP) (component of TFIID and TFIIIB)